MKSLLLRDWQAFLRYEDLPGKNPTSIYLAGLGEACHATFASIVAQHSRLVAHRSVFVDLLGCGFSDGPKDFGYSLEEHADTVARLLDELDLRGCSVIGYSMGGALAITLAATRPDLVSRLVLMEGSLRCVVQTFGLTDQRGMVDSLEGRREETFPDPGVARALQGR